MRNYILLVLGFFVTISSCSKDETPEFMAGDKGELEVEFDNVMGGNNLQLNSGSYTNATGEVYTISKLDYYISNISLKNVDGTTYNVPRDSSYFLIRESDGSQLISLENIPAGNYTAISFIIGIDSLKSAAPASEHTGVLDPLTGAAGMYWGVNEGYIFLKMEGTSNVATSPDKKFQYHIGGYGGSLSPTFNNIKNISLNAPAGMAAEVRKDKPEAPHIHIFTDAAKIMNGITNVSIATHTSVMFEPYSVNLANNYSNMFKIDHIHND